jgi:RND family efflux transporter MFP subunit
MMMLTLLTSLAACAKEAPEDVESDAAVPVVTTPARGGSITAAIRAAGLVTPAPGAELTVVAPEPGRIAAIPKAEGDVVRRGEVLVRFEIPSATAEAAKQRAEITRADARLTAARAAASRAADLFNRGVASRRELEDATRDVADAEADLANARSAASAAEAVAARSVVRATFDGIVAKRSHNPGDLVEAAAGDIVLRVIDPRHLEVTAALPLAEAPLVRVGAVARIVDAPAGASLPSLKVISGPTAVEPGAVTVPVRLAFRAPANYPAGSPVQVEIDGEMHAMAVIVPAAAIVHEGEETLVLVAVADKAQRRPVTIGIESHDEVEITSGLEVGELVIVSGQNGLPDGARITPAASQ